MSIQAVNNGGLITTPKLQGQEQPAQGLTKRAGLGGWVVSGEAPPGSPTQSKSPGLLHGVLCSQAHVPT